MTSELRHVGRSVPRPSSRRNRARAKPALSVERIAETAARIADSDGIEAVAMHRVADELGFTKMALYRYVSGKDELVAAMIEVAVGTPLAFDGITHGWRARADEFVRQISAAWREHPWLPWITIGDRIMGPNELGWIETAVSIFDHTALNDAEKMDAVFTIFGQIRNTQSTTSAGTQPWTGGRRASSTTAEQLLANPDRFPILSALVAAGGSSSGDHGREFGLQRLFDGIDALLAQRQGKRDS